jgi:hypothetical protein
MLHRAFFAAVAVAVLLCQIDPVSAQTLGAGNVSGSAHVRLKAKPSKLRLQVQLTAHGTTPEIAIKHLKSQREAVAAELEALKADPKSISLSVPSVVPMQNHQRVPMPATSPAYGTPVVPQPAVSDQPPPSSHAWSAAPAVPPASAEADRSGKARPKLFVASMTLRADWPLQGDDIDALVASAATIREKVLAADLTADKVKHAMTPEEQELVEEAAMTPSSTPPPSGMFASPSADGRAGVAFVYVAVISDEQRKTLMANGFAQAKKAAEELAEAAGKHLGDLVSLYCRIENTSTAGRNFGPEYADSAVVTSDEHETVAEHPDRLDFNFEINAEYDFLNPKGKSQDRSQESKDRSAPAEH